MASVLRFAVHLLFSFAAVAQATSSKPLIPKPRPQATGTSAFDFEEASIAGIQAAFDDGRLTSVQLVRHYLDQIASVNPRLHAVLEVSPDALSDAAKADSQRATIAAANRSPLHGIPVLIKDSIATRDGLNTTSGSLALLGSVVPRDAGVIVRLRHAGAIIFGKASMSEWDHFRSLSAPQGWCPRGGQGQNPYPGTDGPCGTSSGSAIAVAANLVTVSLGTDLDGAITCPARMNSVVGIKPTVGITSRSGIIPISYRLDTVGPMARTVADAIAVLDAISGFDEFDASATRTAQKFIPTGGFHKLLNADGLKGKRIGVLKRWFEALDNGSTEAKIVNTHFDIMRQKGATFISGLEIQSLEIALNASESGEGTALIAEFKISLEEYLRGLISSPVRTLADIIAFNNQRQKEERVDEFGQTIFLASEKTSGLKEAEKEAINKMVQLSKKGLERLMKEDNLDAIVFTDDIFDHVFAIGGNPIITVPAGYTDSGAPFGISFGGLFGSDSKLIEIAYAFEQATKVRKPPPLQN